MTAQEIFFLKVRRGGCTMMVEKYLHETMFKPRDPITGRYTKKLFKKGK